MRGRAQVRGQGAQPSRQPAGRRGAGAEAIAAMLRTNRSLTSLNLRHNKSIGDAGKKAVREAVKGRAGFGLYLSFDFGARGARSLVFDEWLVISKGNFILFETGRR